MSTRHLLLCVPLLCACPSEDPSGGGGGGGTDSGEDAFPASGNQPAEDEWTLEIDQPFDPAVVQSLIIGGLEHADNFANRGDIAVQYAATDRITVEMRRFTSASNATGAQQDFDRLNIWAYETAGSPNRPDQMDAADACIDPSGQAPWRDGCQIRVYYDGLVQLARSGADFRVTLPKGFAGALGLGTEDNDADPDYQDRATVCVEDLAGSADVFLGAGEAFVSLATDLNPFPLCTAEDISACEQSGWQLGCPCLATQAVGTRTIVRSGDGQAADITVDVPEDLWARYTLRNEADGMEVGNEVDPGALCVASVSAGSGVLLPSATTDPTQAPWFNDGLLNQPPNGVQGAGYGITLLSDRCEVVLGTEYPEDFEGDGNGADQEAHERGNLSVCAGCVRTLGCEALTE
ncbi:MAG: hypothetical protein ACRBN8_11565 [Nannocystales bacterium]